MKLLNYTKMMVLGVGILVVLPAQAQVPEAAVEPAMAKLEADGPKLEQIQMQQHTWVARNFRFHTDELLPELKLFYTTIGNPEGIPVLILHGTNGSGQALAKGPFGKSLFGPGDPLDARYYYSILPDGLGTGGSSKPSDGLADHFPAYNYSDMVEAQYRLLTQGLKLNHVRLVMGFSMGGMHTWMWASQHPDFMDAIVPMAALPMPMSGRNWMLRRMLVEAIRKNPDNLGWASAFYALASNGGNQGLQYLAPNTATADALVSQRLKTPVKADANDTLYQWNASRDFNPDLSTIRAQILVINSADDERNPPELKAVEAARRRLPQLRSLLIPASSETKGHSTVGDSRWWRSDLAEFIKDLPASR
ncbi:alpha/beta fold hydrolase [Amphibiibacter pelophylacis]|uniref:Alpha/beta fold hydrolase n=1 Tax=Amphibiibacter pelophylacis TaxID=1799477 RepID=A0ACC6NYQ7_9BURK